MIAICPAFFILPALIARCSPVAAPVENGMIATLRKAFAGLRERDTQFPRSRERFLDRQETVRVRQESDISRRRVRYCVPAIRCPRHSRCRSIRRRPSCCPPSDLLAAASETPSPQEGAQLLRRDGSPA